jgi:DNA invertase Pin-like site-specific DNA recombinase
METVAGYCRVSTREQGREGLSLASQRATLIREAAGRGWTMGRIVTEVGSGARVDKREELTRLLAQLDAGAFGVLMVCRLDRLSRSVGDFAELMDRAKRHGWKIVLLDPAVDMSTPFGEAMAGMASVFAQLERSLNSQRTREGLRIARARGAYERRSLTSKAGRYRDRAVIDRMVRWRDAGVSEHGIAARLNAEEVPSPRGAIWRQGTVHKILAREGRGNERSTTR